jgi:glycosyltransferase involved in cell wall biosynthesis
LRYVRLPAKGLPNARNAGIARGEIIIFIDDDVELLPPEFLAAHAVCYGDPSVGALVVMACDFIRLWLAGSQAHLQRPRLDKKKRQRAYASSST